LGTFGEHDISNASDLTFTEEKLFDLSVDSTFKAKFLDSSIAPFLIYARGEYPAIASKALGSLLPFRHHTYVKRHFQNEDHENETQNKIATPG
jgi:hypothetical protein